MYYSIDRFEEEWAVLQDDNGRSFTVERSCLPAQARQGEILAEKNGAYFIDENETAARRERIRRLKQSLRIDPQ